MKRWCTLLMFTALTTSYSCGRDTYGDDMGVVDASDATSFDAHDAAPTHDAHDASPQDSADAPLDTQNVDGDSECAITQCAIKSTPDVFDHTTCAPFNCGDILAVCIVDGEDSEFELNASLQSVGKFDCSVSKTRCIGANIDCSDGICCALDKTSFGTFEGEFYPEMCAASELIMGVGCVFVP